MTDSERYLQPPPPYELSLEYDQAFDSDVSRGGPFLAADGDSKRSTAFPNKFLTDPALHAPPNIPKRSAGSPVNRNPLVPRPLPPSPADIRSRSEGSKFGPTAEIRSFTVQNDHGTEDHSPLSPSFPAIGPSPSAASYTQNMLHPSTSVHPSPSHHPPQLSHDAPRHSRDDRWRVSTYSPIELESSSGRSSSMMPSPSSQPRDDRLRTRLSFDPSVAYSNSRTNTSTALPVQRRTATSLYSSAVTSHLCSDPSIVPGSRQYA